MTISPGVVITVNLCGLASIYKFRAFLLTA
jgi:hypothetical protein